MPNREQIVQMLETIVDPEIGVDIWTMGLVYDIGIQEADTVRILMTFTSPFCPAGDKIKEEITDAMRLLGFKDVRINITFDPPWQPSAALKAALGMST